MPIRKRVQGKVALHEDAAIRAALHIALAKQERRSSQLRDELKDGTAFDADESQTELDRGEALIGVWKRLLFTPGKLRLTTD